MRFRTNLYNVLVTSAAFLCLFTAFQTTCLVSQNVLESAALESKRLTGDAFLSLAILYASLAALNWIAPMVVIAVGEKLAMFLGSCCYVIYVSVFVEPRDWILYSVSVLNGFGAAVLWTAQGTYITRCSDDETINRHFSLFWSIFQTSQIWGGLYAYFSLAGTMEIDSGMRHRLLGVLAGIGAVGWFMFLALRNPEENFDSNSTLDAFKVEPDFEVAAVEDDIE
ncbi:unnamed protein product [Echinostoma caproni]|uniref:UNC93-like protein MFSD11 n=1 Tax=Echinostoma caproni TaxID=27848 RepID=A0A183AQA1_9TREM|nr:unnamed protein product [Echinostoma caproni]